ncbi:MAG: hypothetical protein F9K24_09100 [Leptonema illini]|uniref:Uncharacterized protein n=1 Tax=Leptonema illini TaxID=183 RepID=A0A833LXE9_9LEPT|nr:MAG: hypothetical protein F9K24_09100 [Leptonema illini]
MEKTERLEQAIQRRNVPEATAERLTAATVTTPHFAFRTFRIGNSIGDIFDIAMQYLLAESIAEKTKVDLYTIEHCEFHSRGDSDEALEALIDAALFFDRMVIDEEYRSLLKELQITDLQRIKSLVAKK